MSSVVRYSKYFLVVMVMLSGLQVVAQDFTRHNWQFGNSNRAIRFSRSNNTPALVTKSALGTGGSAVASHPANGDVLFYTDGVNVFDITNTQMPNGFGLAGNNASNQPASISPIPGTPNQYYIFSNTATTVAGGNIVRSTVDMQAFGNALFPAPALGDVTSKNTAVLNNRSEGMLVIPHANGTDFWLITHEFNSDNFSATLIDATATFPQTVTLNASGTGSAIAVQNFAYHATSGKIAVTPFNAGRNIFILNFDNATGQFSPDQDVPNSAGSIDGQLYDTEWSPTGRYLYISRNDQLLQFDTTNPSITLVNVLTTPVTRSLGLQLAPDTAIYYLYEAPGGIPQFRLGRLTDTDSIASLVIYNADAFGGAINFNGRQFPNFAPQAQINFTLSFTTAGNCANSPVSFYPTVLPGADSLVWDFGDGQTSSQWSPVHIYQSGGTQNVTLTAFLNGQASTPVTQPVNITQFDLQISLVQDTTACRCEFPPPVGTNCNGGFSVTADISGGTPTSIVWSNGDTGATLTPDSAGYYYVVVTDVTGCSAYAGVNVREWNAQDQRANIWYFGQNAAIDFNEQPPVAASGPINTPEGVSVISDRNGEVIFSTDGVRVYDKNNVEVPIPVPPGIGGEPGATQAALIVPVPGDETLYYIFTTQEVHGANTYEVRYSLYDLKLNNGDGGLVEFNQLLFFRSTERITGANGWLIAHEYGNNSFRAYPVTGAGIGNPVISSIGSDHVVTSVANAEGYMKLGGNNVLAVAFSNPGSSNVIELFDFDSATGELSNYRVADTEVPNGQVYGIEFSGDKLFATIRNTPSSLVEFYLDSLGTPKLIQPSPTIINEELGAIQVGPDGQLYVAVNNRPFLGTIQVNADTTLRSGFTLNGFALAGGIQSRLGLPNFIQNVGNAPQQASMLIAGLCFGSPTDFTGSGTDPIDQFLWSFGDGFSANTQVAQHTYDAPGTYLVTLRVTNRCGLDTLLTQQITISDVPDDPTFVQPPQLPTVCNGPIVLEATPATNPDLADLTFLWSTGETTRTIVVDQRTVVGVTITNSAGCTSTGQIGISDNRPQINLGPDQTICQNTPIAPLDASNPGLTYQWEINGTPAGTAQTQAVNTSAPGVFDYSVTVTNSGNGCIGEDNIIFTINPTPNITTSVVDANCGALDGQINLTINSPIGSLFSYTISGPNSTLIQGSDQPTGVVAGSPFGGLGAGVYGVLVTEQVSGCAINTPVSINNSDFVINSVIRQNTCDPLILEVDHTAVGPFTYNVWDTNSNSIVATGTTTGSPFQTTGVPSGNYFIEIINGAGCINTSIPAQFDQDPVVPIGAINVNGCVDPITLEVVTAAATPTFNWTGPGIIDPVANPTTANAPLGQQIYNVRVNAPGFCEASQDVVVIVDNTLTANFTASDACENSVTVTATPTGTFTYDWYNGPNDGTPDFIGNPLTLTSTINNLTLQVRNTLSGCTDEFAGSVNVFGQLLVNLTTSIPCENQSFTLTANTSLNGVPNPGGATYSWFRNGGSVSTPVPPQTLINQTQAGTYRVSVALPGCAPREDEETITLFPAPTGTLQDRVFLCISDANPDPTTKSILLDAGSNALTYEWFLDGVSLNEFTQTYLAEEYGTFLVELTNTFGCEGSDQTIVEERCRPIIVAPTAFRPGSIVAGTDPTKNNGEFWVITNFINDDGFEVFIFNRWGEMVYQSNDRAFRWNGRYNQTGELLPAGTYTYVIKYKSDFTGGSVQEQRGGVVLMR